MAAEWGASGMDSPARARDGAKRGNRPARQDGGFAHEIDRGGILYKTRTLRVVTNRANVYEQLDCTYDNGGFAKCEQITRQKGCWTASLDIEQRDHSHGNGVLKM